MHVHHIGEFNFIEWLVLQYILAFECAPVEYWLSPQSNGVNCFSVLQKDKQLIRSIGIK